MGKTGLVILGIESSCDETAAAIYSGSDGLLSNVIASQTIHEQFGGVVPELASRAHHKKINNTVTQALDEAAITMEAVDEIAVTQGPGLMGSLLVGLSFAKGLALAHKLPLRGINHIDAHMYAAFIEYKPSFPFLALIVSGGHTQIVQVNGFQEHKILGKTRDDAAGEAFDKIGKMLGLPYPAGPYMDKRAKVGDPNAYDFPQAMKNKGLDFSFSGLKTSVLYHIQDISEDQREAYLEEHLNDLCASVSRAIVEVLVAKLKRAMKETGISEVIVAGGVAANSMLRDRVSSMVEGQMGGHLYIPSMVYCTDNAAMIAITGYLESEDGVDSATGLSIRPYTRIKTG